MLVRFSRFVSTVALMSLCAAAVAAEFSADRIYTSTDAGNTTGRVFVSGDLARIELNLPPGQKYHKSIWIYRGDKKKLWHLFPETKTYTEYDAPDIARVRFLLLQNVEEERGFLTHAATRSYLGKDLIGGYDCRAFRYSYSGDASSFTISTVFFSERLHCPVKWIGTCDNTTETCEYQNIAEAKQPRRLFELPCGYRAYHP